MKKLFTILAAVLLTVSMFAQSPQKMSYQAVIRNSSNALIASTAVGMRISILQGTLTGTAVYVETQKSTTNANGLVSLEIGVGTAVTGTFAAINWAKGPYFIKTETDPLGGTAYTISGTSELMSVPYALFAANGTSGATGANNFTHYVGELFGGGIIVAVWKVAGVEKGLIASLVDLSTSGATWSSITNKLIGAKSQHNGQANTTAIVAQGDVSGAAYICDNYISGGFNDWYLPSVWELNQCYNAAIIVNEFLGDTNGFQNNAPYVSSTEYDSTSVWYQDFSNGSADYSGKSDTFRVRAVRRF